MPLNDMTFLIGGAAGLGVESSGAGFVRALARTGLQGPLVAAEEDTLLFSIDHRLEADDPAWKYIPLWKNDPLRGKITIRHLATHSSGIENAETEGKTHFEQRYAR